MEDIDLNIHNYNLDEILDLFQVSYNYDSNDIKKSKEIVLKLHPFKCNLESKYFDFYSLAYKILECLHHYREKKLFLNVEYYPNYSEDNDFVEKVKKIPNFGKYEDANILIDKIINDNKNEFIYDKMKENKEKIEHLTEKKDLIISTPNLNYENSFQNSIVSSSINSIKRISQFKNLHLNSCFRENKIRSTSSNFNLYFPTEVRNVVSLKLASIEIPNSWYLFSSKKKNNTFTIQIFLKNPETLAYTTFEKKICIPSGNYDIESLQNRINSCFDMCDEISIFQYMCFDIDPINLQCKFSFKNGIPEDTHFSVLFNTEESNNLINSAGWILGFRHDKYTNIKTCIKSEGLFDGGGDRYIYFCIDDFQYNRNESNIICFDESSMDKSVLAKIPMINGKLSLVVEQNLSDSLVKTRIYNGPVNLKKINVKLIDKFGEIIDLNHMDFSFTLEIEILYERNGVV